MGEAAGGDGGPDFGYTQARGKPDKRYSGYLIGYGSEAELMVNTTADPEVLLAR